METQNTMTAGKTACRNCRKNITEKQVMLFRDIMVISGRMTEEQANKAIPHRCRSCARKKSGADVQRQEQRRRDKILCSWEPIGIAINAAKEGYYLTDEQTDKIALGEHVPTEEIEYHPID